MNEMLKPVMVASYVLGLVALTFALGVRLAGFAGFVGFWREYDLASWATAACALFLCALATARMLEVGRSQP
jgi:hypothetical protein